MKNTIKYLEKHNEIDKYLVICSLDVHTSNIYMYAINHLTGEILADCNILGGFKAILKYLEKHRFPKKHILILYEAGTTGFFPYRLFKKRGVPAKLLPQILSRRKEPKKNRQV